MKPFPNPTGSDAVITLPFHLVARAQFRHLENGQTKSFKYDSATTVLDVLNSLQQKLGFKSVDHFSLFVEHVKNIRKNKLTHLDPAKSLAWVFISNILYIIGKKS